MYPKPIPKENKRAIIYCRVSTKEQVDEGNSLKSQEKNCREYALKTGYEIAEVFIEQGESAKTSDRTQLKKLLNYCADKKNHISAVLIYKLDRISRNTDDYSQIRILLKRYGVEIKSTTEFFEDSPAGRFMENIIANVAQFDNDVRTERCVGGMRDAMREGRYVWAAPIGYDNVKIAGKSTIKPNSMAVLLRKTFEMVAQNQTSTEEVRRHMVRAGLKSKRGNGLTKSHFYKLLKNELYMGQIVKFGERHRGTFEPLVTEELFQQVQRVLKHRTKRNYLYQTENPDFPLRRFVIHKESGKKLTGCWAQGSTKKFAYYYFQGKGKSYKKDDFEKDFCKFVNKYKLNNEHVKEFRVKINENLVKEQIDIQRKTEQLEAVLLELNEKQRALIQKNLSGIISDTVLRQQLDYIETEIFNTQSALSGLPQQRKGVEDMANFICKFLKSPGSAWQMATPSQKILLQWFEFPKGVTFDGLNFRTTEICKLFKVKQTVLTKNCQEVDFKNKKLNARSIHNSKNTENSIVFWEKIANEISFVNEVIYKQE